MDNTQKIPVLNKIQMSPSLPIGQDISFHKGIYILKSISLLTQWHIITNGSTFQDNLEELFAPKYVVLVEELRHRGIT